MKKELNTVTTIINKGNRPLNQIQIQAAEKMLRNALNVRIGEVKTEEKNAITKKHSATVNKLVSNFNKGIEKINKDIKAKYKNASGVSVNTKYFEKNSTQGIEAGFNQCYTYSYQQPDKTSTFGKFSEKIEEIVLRMKLGENLMDEMLALVAEIKKLK